jgi:hypothetical protein
MCPIMVPKVYNSTPQLGANTLVKSGLQIRFYMDLRFRRTVDFGNKKGENIDRSN